MKPGGAILVRDVRRLHRPLMDLALPLYCLPYSRTLRALTHSSFRAGLMLGEFRRLVADSGIERARVRSYFITHLGLERPARHPQPWPLAPILLGSMPIRLMKSFYLSDFTQDTTA